MEFKTITLKADTLNEHRFGGYGSIFGGVPDSYGDIVQKGAFSRSIAERGNVIPILYQHGTTRPIGQATIREDETGLYVDAKFVNGVQAADEAYRLAKAGILTGLSIGFNLYPDGSEYRDGLRYLKSILLMEVSLVTFPACESAQVAEVHSNAAVSQDTKADTDIIVELQARVSALEQRFADMDTKADASAATAHAEAEKADIIGIDHDTGEPVTATEVEMAKSEDISELIAYLKSIRGETSA